MAFREINVRGITWIDGVNLDKKQIYEIVKDYEFHELDIEACLEENQRARIDKYEDYLFIILHFPKFDKKTQTYLLNEFNIFIGRDFIITFRDYEANHIDNLFTKYSKLDVDGDIYLKITTGYILYELVQSMLEKMFTLLNNSGKDIRTLERLVFDKPNESLIKDIMVKKRNNVVLKHMFNPQISVLKLIELNLNNLFKGKMEVYFEDLEDKLDYIVNDISVLEENIDSIEDTLKSIINIRTNSIIRFLTLFSAFFMPLTLITSFYGMNIPLPFADNFLFVALLLTFSTVCMILGVAYIIHKNK